MWRGASGNQDSQESVFPYFQVRYMSITQSKTKLRIWKKQNCFPKHKNAHHEVHSQDVYVVVTKCDYWLSLPYVRKEWTQANSACTPMAEDREQQKQMQL